MNGRTLSASQYNDNKNLSQLEKSKGINNVYNISFNKNYTKTRSAA